PIKTRFSPPLFRSTISCAILVSPRIIDDSSNTTFFLIKFITFSIKKSLKPVRLRDFYRIILMYSVTFPYQPHCANLKDYLTYLYYFKLRVLSQVILRSLSNKVFI